MLDFIIFAQYPLYNNKIFLYMEHTLYKLDKTKIEFDNHCLIDPKLFQLRLNYQKFYAMTYFANIFGIMVAQ